MTDIFIPRDDDQYKPDPDCPVCNGSGLHSLGNSGTEEDGYVTITKHCDCYLNNAKWQ